MNPEQLSRNGSEHSEQRALFAWCNVAERYGFDAADDMLSYSVKGHAKANYNEPEPCLKWFFAIPNGAFLGRDKKSAQINGAKLKAEGLKPGVSDLMLPVPRNGWSGLFIEMKVADTKKGKPSKEQLEFGDFVRQQGYGFAICYGWKKASEIIKTYMRS
jgi:hypothetical protein